MAAEWEGKSRGTVLGYKIFVFFISKLGIRAAYFLLYFVAFYFCLFSGKSTKAIFYYLHKRRGCSKTKSIYGIYRSYYKFGQTILDKVAISSGLRNKFTYEFDGIDLLRETLKQQKGGILISAHVGNFEISEFFLDELDEEATISLLITDAEHQAIKEYLGRYVRKSKTKFIIIQDDLSHIFEINAALSRNEIICITGDRYQKLSKHLSASLFGKEAKFPAGPFLLGSRLKVPVLFVYVMKERAKHYHLYARTANVKHRDAQDLLEKYIKSVESILQKYPLQWFNYFDFWEDLKN
ncbi:LpxL/LpxP family acyltransferase [Cochleicola gelatinilyticus]|uniref:Lipid A biosynthesis acyltransferase n=1 Tax=Cochleicola gelatinilyticus TaxID=1763537 RepID=A0A167JC03_9FLAO|nr:lipid A biosynthesis acyltransferase [Cochleicola gelatinilyticus]OAB80527.1 lipid A biosynthesis acyltransferase [Cochleicola gelatinilyticus]